MKSTAELLVGGAGSGRRVPTWAAGLIDALSRDLPVVLTRGDLRARLSEVGSDRDVEATVTELRRLGWLVGLPIRGTWAFVPPGQVGLVDPYLALRGWLARQPDMPLMLAGASAAWHLGYLDRAPEGPTSIWLPHGTRLPDGLRPYATVVQIRWSPQAIGLVGPSTKFLLRRRLDLISWSNGVPAFGPEALLAQLGARPASFGPWADLVTHLGAIVADCDDERLVKLLEHHTLSTWQRVGYLLHAGGDHNRGVALLDLRRDKVLPKVRFDRAGPIGDTPGVYASDFHLIDRLVAPLQSVIGKA